MAKVIVGTTTSLDGFIRDRNGSVAALYPDLEALRETEPLRESIRNTGAVVMGRNAFGMAEDPDSFADNYEYQVPIFVLTHDPPKRNPKENVNLNLTFVTGGIKSQEWLRFCERSKHVLRGTWQRPAAGSTSWRFFGYRHLIR